MRRFRKETCILIAVVTIISSSFGAVALAQTHAFQTVTSTGAILYPASPVIISAVDNETMYTSFGSDYCVYYDSGDPERWMWHISNIGNWKLKGFNAIRLGFVFENSPIEPLGRHGSSVYTPEKLERVLEIFSSVDVKVILMLQNNYDCKKYIGSPDWRTSWLDLVQTFKGDQRIAAIALFSEPQHNEETDAPWEPYDTWHPSITTRLQLQQEFAFLIEEIHKIDPDRIVIYPYPGFQYDDYYEWFADLQETGVVDDPNVVFDIVHPYFFENAWDLGMTPTEKALWYTKNQIEPAINFFGANRVWCGETFVWDGMTYDDGQQAPHSATESLQVEWLTAIINQFVVCNMDFTIWDTIPGSSGGRWEPTEISIDASDFI